MSAPLNGRLRDPGAAQDLAQAICARSTQATRLMEFCGGHTHAILRFGIPMLLLSLIHI